jgi:hypothetical protein
VTAAAAVRLACGDATIRVTSAAAAPVQWLEEFLAPWFRAEPDGTAGATVILTLDGRRVHALRRAVGPGAALADTFVLDSRVMRCPAVESPRGRWTVVDEAMGAVYVVDRDRARVEVVAAADESGARVALMRVVRELATGGAARRGAVLLHAGALALGDRAVVVAGPKGAGKTTLLLHLLHAAGTRFVANDRVVVGTGTPSRVRGMPSIVAIRPGTLERLPRLRARLGPSPATHWLTLAETAALPDRAPGPPSTGADRSPAQLCAALRRPMAAGGRLAALLFPCADPPAGHPGLVRLGDASAHALLLRALFGDEPGRRSRVFDWLGEDARVAVDLAERCRALAAEVPTFVAGVGAMPLDDGAAAARWLATVLA